MRARSASPKTVLFAGGLIVFTVLAAYWGSFSGPFVLDDAGSILDNPTIRQLWPIGPVLSPPGGGLTVSGRPMLNLSLALNRALGGTAVGGYHAFNLAIHLAAALALFGLARRTFLRPVLRERYGEAAWPLAWALAVIWAVHPLQTESVTYVVQRAESLMGLFYLLTMYSFVRGVEAGDGGPSFARGTRAAAGEKAARRLSFLWFGASWLGCLFGMATKEVMVSAPVIVLLYDRTFVAGTFREAWRRRWRLYLGLASTWILLGILVASNDGRGGTSGFGSGVPWGTYVLTQFDAVARYLGLSLWPHPLIFDYGTERVKDPWSILPAATLVIGLMAATAYALFRTPGKPGRFGKQALGFAGAWFFAILAPTSLVPGNRQTLAEHRMYLALAPLAALAVCGLYELSGRPRKAAGTLLAGLVLAAGLTAVTVRRNEDYRSGLALWSDTVAKRPLNPFAQNNLGDALQKAGRTKEAIRQFEQAVRLKPDSSEARSYLAGALVSVGRVPEAIAQCQEALRLSPINAAAHSNWGFALAASGKFPDAIRQYEEALRLRPDFPEARFNLGDALMGSGRMAEAATQFAAFVRLKPDDSTAYNNWGFALAASGKLPEAITEYAEALRLNPGYGVAHFNLGNAWYNSGDTTKAIAEYEAAVRDLPEDAQIHYSLGIALAQVGRLPEAIAQCEQALRLRPDFPEAGAYLDRLRRATDPRPIP